MINHMAAEFISWACYLLPMKVLKQERFRKIRNWCRESCLEPVKYLWWNFSAELFTKKSIIDFRVGCEYASVMK